MNGRIADYKSRLLGAWVDKGKAWNGVEWNELVKDHMIEFIHG